ncbi:MAG: isochorismatase family protein [Tetrasphaera sp.]
MSALAPLGGDDWLVVIDPQAIFADPATSAWGSPMFATALPRMVALAAAYGPERTILTRFVADPGAGGSWGAYYRDWPFALVPDDDPLYVLVPELAGAAGHVVTCATFGKWGPALRAVVGEHPRLTLAGVSTDCCVIATALPAADAGASIRIAANACAGSTRDDHEHALAVLALFAPQIVIAAMSDKS